AAEEDPVVGQDADGIPLQPCEAAHQRLAVALLELVELAAVDEAGDHLADVVAEPRVGRDDAVELLRMDRWRRRLAPLPWRLRLAPGERADDLATDRERVLVIEGVVIGDAARHR